MAPMPTPQQRHPLIAWFAENTVVANIVMVTILVTGVWTAIHVRKESFPTFDAESVTITVPFLGGTPEDVERGVTIKIEESLQGIEGIVHIRSTSTENSSVVTVEAVEDYPILKLLDDVKIQVDAIPAFPEQAEKPVIAEQKRRNTVMWVTVKGDVEEAVLKETARGLRDEFLRLSGISRVETFGARDYEISIEVSENLLRTYGLTFDEVAEAVSNSSIDLAGGVVRSERGEISIRSRNQAYVASEFAAIPLRTTAEGIRIRLGDVARIRDGFVDQEALTRFDGQPAVSLQLTTEGNGDIIQAAKQVQELVRDYPQTRVLPAGVTVVSWNDGTVAIRSRLSLLIKNGLFGVGLVVLSLALFLNLRLAFWVAMGIPISIAGAFMLFPLPAFDLSLNLITAFAFLVVLGILVDDAIVVGESIFSAKEQQKRWTDAEADHRATVRGVSKVFVPAVFGVVTTIAAFYPLTQVSGRMGSVFGQMATVVIFCLVFSVIESKIILPSHLAHINVHKKPGNVIARAWARFQGGISGGLRRFITGVYQPLLRRLFGIRYVVLFSFLAVLVLVGGLMPAGKLRFVFFPDIFRDSIAANLELEQGLPVDYLHAQARRITDALVETVREFEEKSGEEILLHVHTAASTNTKAAISAELTASETRRVSTAEIVGAWRQRVGAVAGAKALTFSGRMGPPGGEFNVQLESENLDSLRAAAEALKKKVATFPGVYDIQDSFDTGRPEIQLELTPEGEAAGISRRRLAQNTRDAFYGREAQRVQRGRDEIKVMVRYPIEERRRLETLREMRVRSTDGAAVPFSIVADARYGEDLASIERSDFRRIVRVTAEIDKAVTSNEEVLQRLAGDYFPALRAEFPGVEIALRGAAEQRAKSMKSLRTGFVFSIVLIYVLLAIPLKSYLRPLLIMSVIPFGIVGALLGHYLMGMAVSILSLFGILALSGVVVNDSLVLVHRLNDLRREDPGLSLEDAIHAAAGQRFRAILLTSITTFVGLTPLLSETAVQAQFLKPMAISLGFGVLFATFITLLLLPMILLVGRDLRDLLVPSFAWWRDTLGLAAETEGS